MLFVVKVYCIKIPVILVNKTNKEKRLFDIDYASDIVTVVNLYTYE